MNLVQEMFRLGSLERLEDAVVRLSGLFHVMAEQPGFLSAEALRNVDAPETVLALHAWRDVADWQRFQRSDWKADFMASRPAGLYDPLPCGMNWRSLQADGAREGSLLRREVLRGDGISLRSGEGIEGSQTYIYVDDEPEYRACTLRLSRLTTPPRPRSLTDSEVLAGELFQSLVSVSAPGVSVFHHPAALPR